MWRPQSSPVVGICSSFCWVSLSAPLPVCDLKEGLYWPPRQSLHTSTVLWTLCSHQWPFCFKSECCISLMLGLRCDDLVWRKNAPLVRAINLWDAVWCSVVWSIKVHATDYIQKSYEITSGPWHESNRGMETSLTSYRRTASDFTIARW